MQSFLKKNSLLILSFGLVVLNIVIFWQIVVPKGKGVLTFSMMNVGQGDALYIEAPNGNQIVIDGGPGPQILRELPKLMPFGDRSLDMLVVTNPDKDHYAGFFDVLSRYSVAMVGKTETRSDTLFFTEFEKNISEKKIPTHILQKGDRIIVGGGAVIDVLFPDQNVSNWSSNDGSLVARLSYGSSSVFLTGDSTEKIENYLLRTQRDSLQSDIIKVPHHGSRTSSSFNFVKDIHPSIALISAGKDNSYGHPHLETINTFIALKIPYHVTAEEGTITYISDGSAWVRK